MIVKKPPSFKEDTLNLRDDQQVHVQNSTWLVQVEYDGTKKFCSIS